MLFLELKYVINLKNCSKNLSFVPKQRFSISVISFWVESSSFECFFGYCYNCTHQWFTGGFLCIFAPLANMCVSEHFYVFWERKNMHFFMCFGSMWLRFGRLISLCTRQVILWLVLDFVRFVFFRTKFKML